MRFPYTKLVCVLFLVNALVCSVPGILADSGPQIAHETFDAVENRVSARNDSVGAALSESRNKRSDITGRLKPQEGKRLGGDFGIRSQGSVSGQWMTTVLGLGIVLGLILCFAYAFRKHLPVATRILPSDVVEILGRRFIDQRNCVQLIRCGRRILIVAHSPTHGLQTLGEVTDPVEVDSLAGRCRQVAGSSTTNRFEQIVAGQVHAGANREMVDGGDGLEMPALESSSKWFDRQSAQGRRANA